VADLRSTPTHNINREYNQHCQLGTSPAPATNAPGTTLNPRAIKHESPTHRTQAKLGWQKHDGKEFD